MTGVNCSIAAQLALTLRNLQNTLQFYLACTLAPYNARHDALPMVAFFNLRGVWPKPCGSGFSFHELSLISYVQILASILPFLPSLLVHPGGCRCIGVQGRGGRNGHIQSRATWIRFDSEVACCVAAAPGVIADGRNVCVTDSGRGVGRTAHKQLAALLRAPRSEGLPHRGELLRVLEHGVIAVLPTVVFSANTGNLAHLVSRTRYRELYYILT